jgi:hypothetical protein
MLLNHPLSPRAAMRQNRTNPFPITIYVIILLVLLSAEWAMVFKPTL